MKFRTSAVAGFVGLIAALSGMIFVSPAASAKPVKAPVFWIDLMGTAEQHPKFIFFTANAGGQVKNLKWTGWGKNRTVGKGIYHDSSPTFPGKPNREGPVRIVAWKPIKCVPDFGNRKGKTIRIYKHARMKQKNGKGGTRWVDISEYAGSPVCR